MPYDEPEPLTPEDTMRTKLTLALVLFAVGCYQKEEVNLIDQRIENLSSVTAWFKDVGKMAGTLVDHPKNHNVPKTSLDTLRDRAEELQVTLVDAKNKDMAVDVYGVYTALEATYEATGRDSWEFGKEKLAEFYQRRCFSLIAGIEVEQSEIRMDIIREKKHAK